jgi:hypothetical protein
MFPWESNVARSFCRVVQVGVEVGGELVGLVGMRNAIPAQAEVQGEAIIYAPVVLRIDRRRDVIPVAGDLDAVLRIRLGVAEQEICVVVPRESAVEGEVAFGVGESILNLLVECPTEAKLQLVRSPWSRKSSRSW